MSIKITNIKEADTWQRLEEGEDSEGERQKRYACWVSKWRWQEKTVITACPLIRTFYRIIIFIQPLYRCYVLTVFWRRCRCWLRKRKETFFFSSHRQRVVKPFLFQTPISEFETPPFHFDDKVAWGNTPLSFGFFFPSCLWNLLANIMSFLARQCQRVCRTSTSAIYLSKVLYKTWSFDDGRTIPTPNHQNDTDTNVNLAVTCAILIETSSQEELHSSETHGLCRRCWYQRYLLTVLLFSCRPVDKGHGGSCFGTLYAWNVGLTCRLLVSNIDEVVSVRRKWHWKE